MVTDMPDAPLTIAQALGLTAASEPYLSCDECFDRIDASIEAMVHDGRRLDGPMRIHLANCAACREEAETLVALVADHEGMPSDRALHAFRDDLGQVPDA